MKNIFKKTGKFISTYCIGFILGALVVSVASAETTFLLLASDVTYDNTNTGMSATNVQSALETIDNRISELEEEVNSSYAIGQEVTILNEKYNVIGSGDDYVTLLKQEPLTTTEINTYGAGHVNMYNVTSGNSTYHTAYDYNDTNHTGGMAYYSSADCGYGTDSNQTETGCTTDYATSEVKYVIDSWAAAKFTNGELKTVDGYGARLITLDEITTNFGYEWGNITPSDEGWVKTDNTPSWVYNSNWRYWTMIQYNDSSSDVFSVSGDVNNDLVYNHAGAVRPVINVYKSKI